MAMDAVMVITQRYFGRKLRHAVALTDHSNGLLNGMSRADRPSLCFASCWPHLSFKFTEGKIISKSHPHFDEIYPMLLAVHLAHTKEMKELLESCLYDVWAEWESRGEESGPYTTRQLWNEYFIHPWDNWSICCAPHVPAMTPANNCIESWHASLMRNLKGQLRGSFEFCMMETFPKIFRIDDLNMASTLEWQVSLMRS